MIFRCDDARACASGHRTNTAATTRADRRASVQELAGQPGQHRLVGSLRSIPWTPLPTPETTRRHSRKSCRRSVGLCCGRNSVPRRSESVQSRRGGHLARKSRPRPRHLQNRASAPLRSQAHSPAPPSRGPGLSRFCSICIEWWRWEWEPTHTTSQAWCPAEARKTDRYDYDHDTDPDHHPA